MEKYIILLGVCLVANLALAKLVWSVVKMWRKVRKKKKDMGRLKAGSVWRQRPRTFLNDPFVEDARFRVTVQETRVNSDDRMWVRYLHKSGLEDTDPADVFVEMYIYVEGPPIKVYASLEEVRERMKRREDPSPALPIREGEEDARGSKRTGED